ncbi:hypothetical protein BDY17DRAFT_321529 [Neohortaea acidophila]|uniref:Uncharacterized protein n=1 Tax=Neohortaea acidophila TaxID=245834 RepID=A0A6A6Q448_9PEZI|nr:uncharacterized protein BDY17DRAFT_321529 [Neohortaea acidophila]KAF2486764.1 hypothetical protein BDY17DRAFT_321529 [Neohortaea acidophila]
MIRQFAPSRGPMDLKTIPRMNSIVLTGLDYSMKPEHVRFESSKQFITPFPQIKVMHLIKSLALMIYNQEKLIPYYHANVCDGRNSLAYFICAMHRQTAPQPMTKTHSRQNSIVSTASDHSTASCRSATPGKTCELPKLCTTSMLPLGYWDSLFYALVAEIRSLRDDLERRFGFACEIDNPVLHAHGPDGDSNAPFTAVDFAVMLETAWYALMDNRLVATLDDAVRMKNLREGAAKVGSNRASKEDYTMKDNADDDDHEEQLLWPPPIVPGLVDVCGMLPEQINEMLWENHMPAINRACQENFEDESMLTAYRAELHARDVEAAIAAGSPLPSASFCPCHRTCVCKIKCDKDADQCTCLNSRAQVYHLVREQELKKKDIHAKYVKAEHNVPNQFLGAATNTLAQMQIAAMANPSVVNVKAVRNIHDANNVQEVRVARKLRDRSGTNDSDLAYVPNSTPATRGPKDPYPLDFYRSYSPQRYPKMHQQETTYSDSQAALQSVKSSLAMPSRKPVPAPISTSSAVTSLHQAQPSYPQQFALTPPSSTSFDAPTFAQGGQVTYPEIPASHSQSMFTQSYTHADPYGRDAGQSVFSHHKDTHPGPHDPANQYTSLLSRHPSTLEHGHHDSEPSPLLSRPHLNIVTHAATTDALPTLSTLGSLKHKPQPELPGLDFISPKPANKQRYVPAGGNAKLSERPEIPGPALPYTTASNSGTITKAEIDAILGDEEFVRRHFGEEALHISPQRCSEESNNKRKSDESEASKKGSGDKRDRTSSSASNKIAAWKNRVFSSGGRKNSRSEGD